MFPQKDQHSHYLRIFLHQVSLKRTASDCGQNLEVCYLTKAPMGRAPTFPAVKEHREHLSEDDETSLAQ